MRIDNDIKLGFKDVLIRPKRSTLLSRKDVVLEREYTFMHAPKKWKGIPIIAANMDTVGTFSMAKVLADNKVITALHKYYTFEEWDAFCTQEKEKDASIFQSIMISTGKNLDEYQNLKKVLQKHPEIEFICIDVANGYSEGFSKFVSQTRDEFPDKIIIAGNVVTGEMTEQLILSGADIVKVGIGSGSVCTTRIKTGVGYPQLSAIIECADVAHGLGGLIIGDGGCSIPGDLSKAFGAGADFVMMGGMFAGHEECEGKKVVQDGVEKLEFYGMSSERSMLKHMGNVAQYRTSEGKRALIPYRGTVQTTINDILGGIRSTCTYVGAKSLKELSKRTTFIRVNEQHNPVYDSSAS